MTSTVVVSTVTEPRLPPARRRSAWHLLALSAGTGAVMMCAGPISDLDVWWHVEVGAYTLRGERFPRPDPWSATLPDVDWHTTSWLSELVLAGTQRSLGWAGVVGLRLAVTVVLVVLLWRLLVRHSPGWAGPAIYAVLVIPLTGYVQERPQTASLLFLVWLSGVGVRLLHTSASDRPWLPKRWPFVATTYAWALVHGLFVLAPACLFLLSLCLLLDRGARARDDVRALLTTASLALAAAAVTPMGPRLLLAPVTVGRAARGQLAEWLPTTFAVLGSWGFGGVVLALGLSWARSRTPASRGEVLYTTVLTIFGLMAFRNAGPASILLAPVAVHAMSRAWNTGTSLTLPPRLFAVTLAGCALAVGATYVQKPVLPQSRPATIAAILAAQPGQLLVFNDYNVSGYLISEASPHVRLVVDGRADRYGNGFIRDHGAAVAGEETWAKTVDEIRPDVAVLGKSQALAALLISAKNWTLVQKDHEYVLLARPGVALVTRP